MRTEFSTPVSRLLRLVLTLGFALLLGACASMGGRGDEPEDARNVDRVGNTAEGLLNYYYSLASMSGQTLARERRLLSQLGTEPDVLLRRAMVLGHPRQPNPDLLQARYILESLLKRAKAPELYRLRPLFPMMRQLADGYGERIRLEKQLTARTRQMEKQYQKLLAFQRQANELQEKLNGLANIERTLPRSRAQEPSQPAK
ncbi:MAG: hypothetical protein LBR88_02195 [Zoogloeaceae bacterium]|jgi:hypothetical protein|nr:hypothetical protein [Zoogloeaceae bacterium]